MSTRQGTVGARLARAGFAVSALLLGLSLLGLAAVSHQRELDRLGTVAGLPNPNLAPRPTSLYGVNVALEQYADPTSVLEHLRPFYWLRQTFPWDRSSPKPASLPGRRGTGS